MAVVNNREGILVTEEVTVGWVVTTYVWIANDTNPNITDLVDLKWEAIWKINMFVKTTAGWVITTDEFQPCIETVLGNGLFERSTDPIFTWDDRATLTYK